MMLINNLAEKYVTIADIIMLMKYGKASSLRFSAWARSLTPSTRVAKDIGIYNINENVKATSFLSPESKPPTIVEPLLDIPGKSAIAWNKPIFKASK